ncbi:MAG: hypothetical protein PHC52_14090, partial [Syntrophales bacterium]|nr:hypothetical protein [Syntrophales bacterium]
RLAPLTPTPAPLTPVTTPETPQATPAAPQPQETALEQPTTESATTPPVPPVETPPTALAAPAPEDAFKQLQANNKVPGKPRYTKEQAEAVIKKFGEILADPKTVKARELAVELRKQELSRRVASYQSQESAYLAQGMSFEEAAKKALEEMRGALPNVKTDLEQITDELRDALFAKVYHDLANEPFEQMATVEALTNALSGRSVPMKPGTGTKAFPDGGSAYLRLQRVFGGTPEVLKRINDAADKKQNLKDVVDGVFWEQPEGGRPPTPIDESAADYLRKLPASGSQQTAGMIPPGEAQGLLTYDPTGKPSYAPPTYQIPTGMAGEAEGGKGKLSFEPTGQLGLNVQGGQQSFGEKPFTPKPIIGKRLSPAEARIEKELLQAEIAASPEKVDWYEAPINDAIKTPSLMPKVQQHIIVRVLKEAGLTAIDIGGSLKAMKASVDMSFGRQQTPLIARYMPQYLSAFVDAWKAVFSQKEADASWDEIIHDPLYIMYAQAGYDFLRPARPLPSEKWSNAWKGVEEYGYLNRERPIPKFVANLPWVKGSERSFVTGANAMNWAIFKKWYAVQLKESEKVASGEIKLRPGEVFSVKENMGQMARLLRDMTGRGPLGPARTLAPALTNLFFAPRYKMGRVMLARDLFASNKYARKEAWANALATIAVIAGIAFLGKALRAWDVEDDPRSADAWKIRIGNTRFDFWGGYQQLVTFVTRLATGKGVNSITGQEYDIRPDEAFTRFLRGSSSPLASLIADIWMGKTFTGETVNLLDKDQWIDRVSPLAIADIREAFADNIAIGVAAVPATILGVGVQTYSGNWREGIANLGKPDAESAKQAILSAVASGASPERLREIQARDYTFTTASLGSVFQKETNKTTGKADYKEYAPLIKYYWEYKADKDRYNNLAVERERERYIQDNPDFAIARLFWSFDGAETASYSQKTKLRELANKYSIPPESIPAIVKKASKGTASGTASDPFPSFGAAPTPRTSGAAAPALPSFGAFTRR